MSDLARALRAFPLCDPLTDAQVDVLAAHARAVDWHLGARIASRGDLVDRSWLVVEGRIAFFAGGAERREVVEPGGLLGWSWLVPPRRWHVDVIAATAARAIELDGVGLLERMERDPALGFAWARVALRVATDRLERARG